MATFEEIAKGLGEGETQRQQVLKDSKRYTIARSNRHDRREKRAWRGRVR